LSIVHLPSYLTESSLDLLMPLTSPARLPKHPSSSIAYTSPILTNMAQHACEMVQRERKTLASAKRLMTKLRGDETWVPCELMCSPKDEAIFGTEKLYNSLASKRTVPGSNGVAARSLVNGSDASLSGSPKSSPSRTELGSASETITGTHEDSAIEVTVNVSKANNNETVRSEEPLVIRRMGTEDREAIEASDIGMLDGNILGKVPSEEMSEIPEPTNQALDGEGEILKPTISFMTERRSIVHVEPDIKEFAVKGEDVNGDAALSPTPNDGSIGHGPELEIAADSETMDRIENLDAEEPAEEVAMDGIEEENAIKPEPRRMRTRAQAHAASEPTASSRTESPDSIPPEVHPLFKIPEKATPDKDFGLPPDEAEETRRLLTMYVQKQEEVCRGAGKLYGDLLRADRQRGTVFRWCKAEGHVGEMSDGEDWYDKEEWGLEEDLEKGHNDEEGDNSAIQGRKPRRRA